jgi:hypothetical protein
VRALFIVRRKPRIGNGSILVDSKELTTACTALDILPAPALHLQSTTVNTQFRAHRPVVEDTIRRAKPY